MQEGLREEKVIEKLKGKGYEPNIYVYGILEIPVSIASAALIGVFAMNKPKPLIVNFSENGIAFLELNSNCSKYTGFHNFIPVENIETLSLKKGMLINTLNILTNNDNNQKIKISNATAGTNWQKNNVLKMMEFVQSYKKK